MHRALFASVLTTLLLAAPLASAQDDVGAAEAPICCGGECCLIGGSCFRRGDTNPADSCQMCDPGASQTGWTDMTGCTPTGGDDAGTGGTPPDPDDGGCSAAPGAGSTGAGIAFGLLALGALVRRRR